MQRYYTELAYAAILFLGLSSPVQAELFGRSLTGTGFDGNVSTYEAYYDTTLNVTWMADANFFRAQAASNPSLVADVIASVGGVVLDTPNVRDSPVPYGGSYALTAADFDTATGRMTWWGAQAWTHYLNSTELGGQSDWRLPTVSPINGSTFQYGSAFDGTRDVGYNISSPTSELGHMFHVTLDNKGFYTTSGVPQPGSGLLNSGPFTNLPGTYLWYDNEYPLEWSHAWTFNTQFGSQSGIIYKGDPYVAWAVRTGDIAAVPLPAAAWLFGSGMAGLAAWARRQPSV